MSLFLPAFQIVVGLEGGYVNDPKDPGGETKWGISKRAYPTLDIKNLTLEQAQQIYLTDYWDRCGCDLMPWDRALCVFDCAVNQGVSAAKSMYILAHSTGDFMAERAARYAANPNFPIYGKGWMNRLFKVFQAAQVTPTGVQA